MDHIIQVGTDIIDIALAVLDHPGGINQEQYEHVATIHRRAVDFVTTFYQMQSVQVRKLRRYLNHDALSPITVIIGYSQTLLIGMSGPLSGPYEEAIQEICDRGYYIHEQIQLLHEEVWQFMQEMGIPK